MGTSVQNFFTSRDNNVDPDTYVGQLDRLWYNPDTNQIFISDGVTPGGRPVDLGANANAIINNLTVNSIGTGDSSAIDFRTDARFTQGATIDVGLDVFGTLAIDGNLTVTGNIPAATTVKIGGVRAGPGANISNTGLLTIDTTGLPLSFGNFTANNNILTIVNVDEDMILATQGAAEIQLVGNIGFYKSNGLPPDPDNRFFYAQDDGQINIFVANTDPFQGAVEIIGSSTGNTIAPGIEGTMLHVTGQTGEDCRLYYDGIGGYVSWVARRWNGNVSNPTQVLANQDVLRINATAATDAGVGNVAMAQIRIRATEDQTTTAQGSKIEFLVTRDGETAGNREVGLIVDNTGIEIPAPDSAVIFYGNTSGTIRLQPTDTAGTGTVITLPAITGNVVVSDVNGAFTAGNITGGNLLTTGVVSATGNITGGNLNTAAQVVATGNITGGNLITGGVISATGNITGANITATANIADSKGDVRSIPVNTQNTGYTLVAADAGKVINMTAGNVTVPAGVFASPFGQAVTIYNDQNSSNAIVSGAGVTLRLAGTAATGNRTLARYGLATVVCVSANTFVISGAGLT